jgi:glycosyltransferase involved in cell wall biosynthesis
MDDLMDRIEERRIGIFEYDWSMYSFIKDLVIRLAEAGYFVDIFQKSPNASFDFTNSEQFKHYSNVRYFNFNTSNTLARKIVRKFKRLFTRLNLDCLQNLNNIIDREILLTSKQIINESRYKCFIGIEKKGLIWAGVLSQEYGCPLIYYSLELYLEDHPGLAAALATREYSYLRKTEKKYHRLCGATIIQDRLRAKALLKYNEIESTNLIYLPISIRGDIVEKKSSYFHQKYQISDVKKLLLYFGLIQDARYSSDLVRIADRLKDDMMLVLHGYGDQTYLAHLQSIAAMDQVIFSFDLVAEEEIINVISSATIGLALYESTNSNDRLAAFSSVKVAYYMQCGVPVIAFDSESFRELMNVYKCGELINSIDEIPQKVEKILNDYDSYREQAFMAFKQFFDFDENFKEFILDFDNFIKNECGVANSNNKKTPDKEGILDEEAWKRIP